MKKILIAIVVILIVGGVGYVLKNVLMHPEAVVEQTDKQDVLSGVFDAEENDEPTEVTLGNVTADKDDQVVPVDSEPAKTNVEPDVQQEPSVAPEVTPEPEPQPEPEVEKMLSGVFFGRDGHDAAGRAVVYKVDGESLLRFENFNVTPGPDLFVYVSPTDVPTSRDLGEFKNLGKLKAAEGEQTYNLPDGYEDYPYVVIWCRAFSHLFAVAHLQ